MMRRRPSRVPRWKQAIAIGCCLYALAAWVLPIFLLPFVNVLPFVHERSAFERLSFSVAGSALCVLALLALKSGRRSLENIPSSVTWRDVVDWFGVSVGLALFTYAGAELSANTFGSITKLLPRESYSAPVVLSSVKTQGPRQGALQLEYREPVTGEARYLVLSKRLFDNPKIQPGDVIELRGDQTWVGVYVNEISVLNSKPTDDLQR